MEKSLGRRRAGWDDGWMAVGWLINCMFQLLRPWGRCWCHGRQGIRPGKPGQPSRHQNNSRMPTAPAVSCCRFRVDACSDARGQSWRPLVAPSEAQPSLAHQQHPWPSPDSLVQARGKPHIPKFGGPVVRAVESGIFQRLLPARPYNNTNNTHPMYPYTAAALSHPTRRTRLLPLARHFRA